MMEPEMVTQPQPVCATCGKPLVADAPTCTGCGTPAPTHPDVVGGPAPRLAFADEDGADATPSAAPSNRVLEAAADPAATRKSPFTLRFASPVLEAAFHAEYRRAALGNARLAAALALVLVMAFGALDWLIQTTVVEQLWIIRYGVLTPYLIALLGATYVRVLRPYLEWGLLGIVVVVGGGILGMILISPPPGRYFYYAGLVLVIMYNYTFIRLRFAVINIAGWAVALTYLGAELIVGRTPWAILVNNMFFFAAACIIGMFAAYFVESLARQNFLQDKLVRRARAFGSYRLVTRLGAGGMGEVWRAEHRLLARPAAIKLIRPEVLGVADARARTAVVRRFEQEAQATALLRSPHTVEVYDFGVTDEGTFYYVMELLRGYDLHTLVRRFGPLPPGRAVRFLRQAAESLAEAHDVGLIHRDVKPANVYVCEYGREVDFVKMLDFGIVKWSGRPAAGDLDATQGGLAGTPSCMAPEQISGDTVIDARTDLYSLGCVAYFMLTGRHVFEAATVVQVLARHIDQAPAPPSSHVATIPIDLEAVVMACLEKDPARRPTNADALAQRLATCESASTWSMTAARQWWTAHPPSAQARPSGEERTVLPSMVWEPGA